METRSHYNREGEGIMNCQDFEELFGAYALGALSPEERQAADAHLAECPQCTHTLKQLQAIVDLFPLSVPAMDPPPRLKAQIIARIQSDEATRQQEIQGSIKPLRRPARWSTTLLAATTLLLLLLVGGLITWNLSLHQEITQLSTRVAPPVTYTIHGTGTTTTATGQILYYPQQDITVLILHGLPRLTGTQVYQGWLLQGNIPLSVGLLNVHNGVATLDFQGNIHGYDQAAISLERGPTASNDAPQGPVVAIGSFKKV